MELTEVEIIAKNHFLNLVTEGRTTPIDPVGSFSFEFEKPTWFDQTKYDLGREYFAQNRFGILSTNFAGLIILLCIPKGLKILNATNKSSDPESARRRYAETIMHTLSWYEMQLKNDTKSWESLKKVRRLHLYASNMAMSKKYGFISQMEVSMTTFGFAGFVLNRAHLFGIKTDSLKHREGFLHFWAVMNYMLGVEDRFNICLLPLKAVQIEFDIIMRNILGPFLQIETKLFKKMVSALVKGMSDFIPLLDYDVQMFLTRRAAGIPGYQYNVDLDKEEPYRNIFSEEEIKMLKSINPQFSEKVAVFRYSRDPTLNPTCNDLENSVKVEDDYEENDDYDRVTLESLVRRAGIPCNVTVSLNEIEKDDNFKKHLNAKKYNKLSTSDKMNVMVNIQMLRMTETRIGKYFMESFLDYSLSTVKRAAAKKQ